MMGSGIAWAHASAGLAAALKDTDIAKAEKGKAYSEDLAAKAVERGNMDEAGRARLLGLIEPVVTDSAFRGADIIVEAVFEDIALKEKVIPQTFAMLSESGIYGSNTSTLPISILAESCPDPTRFIGLHFFSPVDKMKVVEIIMGRKTSADTLRKAYDYVQQIGYMPIVVNDSRGFFTSRVFGTFMDEGMALLIDGMKPAVIESGRPGSRACRLARLLCTMRFPSCSRKRCERHTRHSTNGLASTATLGITIPLPS
ncbi:3-hydroxyacyl-CoA dehydrogenase family protein, partial [Rhizobiaceae sp. 2RAB30]